MLVTRARTAGMLPPGPNSFILVNQRGGTKGLLRTQRGPAGVILSGASKAKVEMLLRGVAQWVDESTRGRTSLISFELKNIRFNFCAPL
ncbi:hypothetical protein CDAR_411821 [Caerostris darwini]|uniref:Uncharacterized protein n=1 Tax=Caerostris darwini TaxID=1538125 RepID=A0AAV4RYH1_9ARAC|nr:hypothetical protein CDAR_411821 [Caerostris darwini]